MKTLPQQIREEADNFKFLPRGIQLNFNNGNTVFTIKKECWMYQYDNWYLLDYENNQVFAYKGKCKIS